MADELTSYNHGQLGINGERMSLVLLGFLSVLIGVLIGATAVGGVILIPLINYLGGIPIHNAMATGLFTFFFTGLTATIIFQRYGSMNWAVTLPVSLGSLITAYIGARVNALTGASALYIILGLIVTASSLYSLLPLRRSNLLDKLEPRRQALVLFVLGLAAGFLCGLTGVGGGPIALPLMLMVGCNPLATIGTGQVLQVVISVSGSASNIANGFVDFSMAWWIALLEVLGIFLGVRVAHKLPIPTLKKAVAGLSLAVGIYMLIRGFV